MEFGEVVRGRRMVRNYTDDPVDPAAVGRILDVARRGPSAGFSQGQTFVVITDADRRHRIASLADEPGHLARGFEPWISAAPVHVAVCTSEAAYAARYAEPDKHHATAAGDWSVPYWWVDAGAALMLILLAAVDEGLAAGFLGAHALPGMADLLDLPPEIAPIGIVTLGHAAADRPSGSLGRGRRPIRDVIRYEHW